MSNLYNKHTGGKRMKDLKNDKSGQYLMMNLLVLVFTLMIMVALIPLLNQILNLAQDNENLNCASFNGTNPYNSSLPTNALACLAIQLYLPYIVLVILIGSIARLIARPQAPELL